jgi:glycosyltransferase involved in cell wall biosynthesis
MKIAFLSFCFPEYCIRHANEMAREHEVLLMLPHNRIDGAEAMIEECVHYQGFYGARYRQPVRQLRTSLHILRTIRKFRPDVIHFQNGYLFFNLVLPLLRRFPLVITIHDPRQHLGDKESLKTPQWIMDFGFRRAHQVIVHGEELIETVHREIGIPKTAIHSIPHIAIGGPQAASEPENLETGLNILFFGRIWEYKGLEYLIQAQPRVTREFPDAKFVIGGKGDDFDRYRKLMLQPDRFEVHNDWINDDERAEMFSRSSVVVLPYIEASQSGVIPLAYYHAKPVIATTVGALPNVVEHNETGLLVPPRNAEALAQAILNLLRNAELRKTMGQAGREKLKRESDPEVVVRQTLDVYRKAISGFTDNANPDSAASNLANKNPSSDRDPTHQRTREEVST